MYLVSVVMGMSVQQLRDKKFPLYTKQMLSKVLNVEK
jgi:hypothetical protein